MLMVRTRGSCSPVSHCKSSFPLFIYRAFIFLRESFENPNPRDALSQTERDTHYHLTQNDMFIKDAFLVFRALCKLTMKPLNNERLYLIASSYTPIDHSLQRARPQIPCHAIQTAVSASRFDGFKFPHGFVCRSISYYLLQLVARGNILRSGDNAISLSELEPQCR